MASRDTPLCPATAFKIELNFLNRRGAWGRNRYPLARRFRCLQNDMTANLVRIAVAPPAAQDSGQVGPRRCAESSSDGQNLVADQVETNQPGPWLIEEECGDRFDNIPP